MRIAVFDAHKFEKKVFETVNGRFGHELTFVDARLTDKTAKLASGYPAVCGFVNDCFDERTLKILWNEGVQLIALRSAGFNHVDLQAARSLGMKVVRVPAYSPHAVAEHAVLLMLALNRKICRSVSRIHDLNFSLEGLVGFDLFGKTVGVVGTGKIGTVLARILRGFGCDVLAYDLSENADLVALGVKYVSLDDLYARSRIISLHVPLTQETRHMINAKSLAKMRPGVMLINTGRGALIDTPPLVDALKSGHVGAAGLDVYEEEENVFFQDLSEQVLQDDVLARLLTFPNVLITSHQAFLTQEALENIAETTLGSVRDFEEKKALKNEVSV